MRSWSSRATKSRTMLATRRSLDSRISAAVMSLSDTDPSRIWRMASDSMPSAGCPGTTPSGSLTSRTSRWPSLTGTSTSGLSRGYSGTSASVSRATPGGSTMRGATGAASGSGPPGATMRGGPASSALGSAPGTMMRAGRAGGSLGSAGIAILDQDCEGGAKCSSLAFRPCTLKPSQLPNIPPERRSL